MKAKGYKPKKQLTMKQKLAGTFLCIIFYRMLSFVPLPFVDSSYIKSMIGTNGSLGLANVLSGGSLGNMSLMALGIGPWITASIILQLIGVAFSSVADMNKDADGKKKYKRITFLLAVILAFTESLGMMAGYGKQGFLSKYTWYTILVPSILMMAGTGILSLMAWYIDERLFGNGTSLILTAGILCSYVNDGTLVGVVLSYGKGAFTGFFICVAALVVLFYLFLYTVFISSCEKRISVTYSKKLAGSGNGKNSGIIPLKMMSGGVVPVIFASTVITFPAVIGSAFNSEAAWLKIFNTSYWLNIHYPWASIGFVIYIVLIIGFSYFCQMMYTNPVELSKKLQKKGAMIPGIRPGKPTTDYIISQAKWLTAMGGISLCIIASIPMIVSGTLGLSNLSFLGTSILITVSTLDESWRTWKTAKLSESHVIKGSVVKGIL